MEFLILKFVLFKAFFLNPYLCLESVKESGLENLGTLVLNLKNSIPGWALVAHAYNPSCAGGRDQEACGSRPAQANSSRDPISKKPFIKKGLVEGSRCKSLSSNLSTVKK
jgi:hypothetical protein